MRERERERGKDEEKELIGDETQDIQAKRGETKRCG